MVETKKPIDWLIKNISEKNIAEQLDEDKRQKIAAKVKTGFDLDDSSRTDWKKQTEGGLKVAEQIVEEKSYPWPKASNVKYPLIAISAIQFAARAYPSIVQDSKVVKAEVVGADPQGAKAERAKRISTHMSWQLTEDMSGWDEETDKLLHILPVVGTVFRKTFYDSLNQQCTSDLCLPLDVVVHMKTKSLEKCRRITHKVCLYKNEVIERERSGLFLTIKDFEDAAYMKSDDEDLAEVFLEQHCWLDLDNDGYEEPYIATVHEDSGNLVRIVARYDQNGIDLNDKEKIRKIKAVQYFTPYFFIPAASGKFYALGFAHLLGPINESINTTLNQLIDAGHLANMQGGFLGRGIRIKGGMVRFSPGEWKQVEVSGGILKDNIVPLPAAGPSTVLFQLLGLLTDTGMKLSSVSETMAGETPSQNTPATTTLAVIEQGLKVFSAIYKRVYRSLKAEYKKIYRLNGIYLDEEKYFRVLDEQNVIGRKDYALDDMDVIPVADPSLASESQRLARVQALIQTIELNPTPEGRIEILRQYYAGINAENQEKLLPMDEQGNLKMPEPPPDKDAIKIQLETIKTQHEEERKRAMLPYEIKEKEATIAEIESRTAKNIADANSVPIRDQLDTITAMVNELHGKLKLDIEREKVLTAGQGDGDGSAGNRKKDSTGESAGMEADDSDEAGSGPAGGNSASVAGAGVDGEYDLNGQRGAYGAADDSPDGGDQGTQPYPDNAP